MFLNVLIIVLQLDYKRGMNGDIRAMVDGKLVKKTEGGIGEIDGLDWIGDWRDPGQNRGENKKVKDVRKDTSCG